MKREELCTLALVCTCILCILPQAEGCGRGRRYSPPRDGKSPVMTCPGNINVLADDKKTFSTGVRWTEPMASDDVDGSVTPTRKGLGPGKVFYEGVSQISYSAKDRSGNYVSCSFDIQVRVVRCPAWSMQANGWRSCEPSHDMLKGTSCSFGCYPGFELVGSDEVVCMATGKWSEQQQPFCKPITCPRLLEDSENTRIDCTDANNYRSKCSYSCISGYDIPPGTNRVLVCSAEGSWNGQVPKCVDMKPPEFVGCPAARIGYTESSKISGRLAWNIPRITDNAGSAGVVVTQIAGPQSGQELDVGEYEVVFFASDKENNTATCKFEVVMKQIQCRTMYPHPYTYISCPTGTGYGSTCNFSCKNGTALDSPSMVQCESYQQNGGSVRHGRWSFGNKQPKCNLVSSCSKPEPPKNGALVCDTWAGGRYCQIQCQDGYLMKHDIDSLLICRDTKGTWDELGKNQDSIPDCNKATKVDIILNLKLEEYFYFDGDCKASQQEIKLNFLYAINVKIGDICQLSACSVDSVQVFCGESNAKRKRDTPASLLITTSIQMSKISTDDNDVSVLNTRTRLLHHLSEERFTFTTSNGSAMLLSLDLSQPTPACTKGYYADLFSMTCVECRPGSYHDTTENSCQLCPRGTYQPNPAQTGCIQCPEYTTTETRGAESQLDCLEACRPGYYSFNGMPPCSPCPVGTYTSEYGTVSCTSCSGSMTTKPSGLQDALSAKDCYEFDIEYTKTDETTEAARVISEYDDLLEEFHVTLWTHCTSCDSLLELTDVTGSNVMLISNGPTLSVTLDGCTIETNINVSSDTGHWHYLHVHASINETVIAVDGFTVTKSIECALSPVNLSSFEITVGGEGFEGRISQVNIRTDDDDVTNEFELRRCFGGPPGNVLSWRQFQETAGTFTLPRSQCDDFDNCLSGPCHNHGQCSDGRDSFICKCDAGFKGSECEKNFDDCVGNSCENGARCEDGENEYSCLCSEGFSGKFCETRVVDGSWSDWESWGQCSVTCGSGGHTRVRVCTNPSPDNGGKDCEGVDTETGDCSMPDSCVYECDSEPTALEHGYMNCSWHDDTRQCWPYCEAGYAFDSDLFLSDISCGPDTGYTWNIRNSDNPDAQIPSCMETAPAENSILEYSAKYHKLTHEIADASGEDVKGSIREAVTNAVSDIDCIKSSRCLLEEINVTNSGAARRKKRDVALVGVTIEVSCSLGKDMSECYSLLLSVKDQIDNIINNTNRMSVLVKGQWYDVLTNSSAVDGYTRCGQGTVPLDYYCVECGLGNYQYNLYCERCPKGSYQDSPGSNKCKRCPEGWTTSGMQTRTKTGCDLADSAGTEELNILVIVLPLVLGVAMVVLALVVYKKVRRHSLNKTRAIENAAAYLSHHTKTFQVGEDPKTCKPRCSCKRISVSSLPDNDKPVRGSFDGWGNAWTNDDCFKDMRLPTPVENIN